MKKWKVWWLSVRVLVIAGRWNPWRPCDGREVTRAVMLHAVILTNTICLKIWKSLLKHYCSGSCHTLRLRFDSDVRSSLKAHFKKKLTQNTERDIIVQRFSHCRCFFVFFSFLLSMCSSLVLLSWCVHLFCVSPSLF